MKRIRKFHILVLVGALIAFLPVDGSASTVGKVTGTVQDESGNPLPGANVVVEGTQRGATSDADGSYLILGVPPGRHEVTASMVGYTTSTQQNVLVQSDFTTTISYTLSEATLEAAEMVVMARRPPVETDRTMTKYVIDIVDLQSVPLARTSEDLLELQPGVAMDGSLAIRGGDVQDNRRSNTSHSEIDGIRLVNNDGKYFGATAGLMFVGINKTALQEVTVMTGGMDAQYGHASSGIIQFVTRDSRNVFTGSGEYRADLPSKKHWGRDVYEGGQMQRKVGSTTLPSELASKKVDYTNVWGHYFEGSVGGPISDQAGFFGSVAHSRKAPIFPLVENREPNNIQASGNVTFRPGGNMKLKLGGMYSKVKVWKGEQIQLLRGGKVENLFLPQNYSAAGPEDTKESAIYAIGTHTISPKTFYEVRVGYTQSLIDTDPPAASSGTIPTDKWGFNQRFDRRNIEEADRKRWVLKGDLTSQMHKNHLVKAGFEAWQYDLKADWQIWDVGASRVTLSSAGYGDQVIGIDPAKPRQYGAYIQDKMEFEGLVINAGIRWDAFDSRKVVQQGSVVWEHYHYLTRHRNAPFVDGRIITSVSPRIGVSHPISERATVRFFTGRFHTLPDLTSFYIQMFRGSEPFSRDVNGDGVINEQTEKYNNLILPHNAPYGTDHVDAAQSTNMEVGADWNFAGDYVSSVTMYYTDYTGTLHDRRWYLMPAFHLAPPGITNENVLIMGNSAGFKGARGFEISFKKMFSHMTSFNLSWNVQWLNEQRGYHFGFTQADAAYVNSDRFFLGVEAQPDGSETPRVPTAAERAEYAQIAQDALNEAVATVGQYDGVDFWREPTMYGESGTLLRSKELNREPFVPPHDKRNSASVQFLFSAPQDYHIKALQAFRATMLYRIQDGGPLNPGFLSNPKGRHISGPTTSVTDLNLEKDFRVGKASTVTGFLEVRNLFDVKDEWVEPGEERDWFEFGLSLRPPDDADFQKYGDIEEHSRYYGGIPGVRHAPTADNPKTLTAPRFLVLGARLAF